MVKSATRNQINIASDRIPILVSPDSLGDLDTLKLTGREQIERERPPITFRAGKIHAIDSNAVIGLLGASYGNEAPF